MNSQMPADACQGRLVLVWIIGLVICVFMLFFQISAVKVLGKPEAVIAWCSQTYAPLIAIVTAKWTGIANQPAGVVVSRSMFRAAFSLSLVYVTLALAAQFEYGAQPDPITFLQRCGLMLGIIMVPLGATSAACFVGKRSAKTTPAKLQQKRIDQNTK